MLKRSSKSKGGQYPTAFKLKAIKRVERGEGVFRTANSTALHEWNTSSIFRANRWGP